MTVPPLFGWGDILAVLVLVVLVAVAFFVFSAAGSDARGRRDLEASLQDRSRRRRYPDVDDLPAAPEDAGTRTPTESGATARR